MHHHALIVVAALSLTSGCHAYHTALFNHQDKKPAAAEPHIAAAPAGEVETLRRGSFGAVHGKEKYTGGTVELVRAADGLYLHASDWSVTEGPDLYFYVSEVDAVTLEDEPKTVGERSAQLTMNNLRPSNLGFEGDSLWLRVPAEYEDAQTVLIHCTKYHKIFGIAALEGAAAVASSSAP